MRVLIRETLESGTKKDRNSWNKPKGMRKLANLVSFNYNLPVVERAGRVKLSVS